MSYKHKNRPSGPELRALLVEEALAVVEARGADSLSATAVSLAVGASNAASYSHFRDGATELLAAVAIRGFDQLAAALGVSSTSLSAEVRVRSLFHRYVQFGLERPHLYRAMFSPRLAPKLAAVNVATMETLRGGQTYHDLLVAKTVAYGAFESSMRALGRESGTPPGLQGDSAKAVATLAHGLVLEFIEEGLDLGTTTEDSRMAERLATASRLIDMLLYGVLTRREEAKEANDRRY